MKVSKQVLWVFLAYYGINCFSNVYFVFGPFYSGSGASPRAVGFFLSLFYMAMIICRPLGSWTMERLGIRRALVGSSLIAAAAAAGVDWKTIFSVGNGVTANTVGEWSMPIDPSINHIEVEITGNTGQAVTCEAFVTKIPSLS